MKLITQTSAAAFVHLEKLKKLQEIFPSDTLAFTIENIGKMAEELLENEMKINEQKFFARNAEAEWWKLARLQYPITKINNGYLVSSKICDRSKPMIWFFDYHFQALQKIEQLVKWVAAKRDIGVGDKAKDLKKFSKVK